MTPIITSPTYCNRTTGGFTAGKSSTFEIHSSADSTVGALLDTVASEAKLPRALLAVFAGSPSVCGTHAPLREDSTLHAALAVERKALAQPHAPAEGAQHTHDLTLAIDESGLETQVSDSLRGVGGSAFVGSAKGEPSRHADDVRRHH